jgi:hypothetical protein
VKQTGKTWWGFRGASPWFFQRIMNWCKVHCTKRREIWVFHTHCVTFFRLYMFERRGVPSCRLRLHGVGRSAMLESTVYMDLYYHLSRWLLWGAGSSVNVLTWSVGCHLLFYKMRPFASDAVLMCILKFSFISDTRDISKGDGDCVQPLYLT